MKNDYYLEYFHNFEFFCQLCRMGFLDTTNHFILDMYNTAIRYVANMKMKSIDFKKLDDIILEFRNFNLQFYMFLHKEDFKEV